MPRSKTLPTAFCQTVVDRLTALNLDEGYNASMEDAEWFIKVLWFPANPDHPDPLMRPTMLEVYARHKTSTDKKARAAFIYKSGSGNDCYPEFGKTGWRFQMV